MISRCLVDIFPRHLHGSSILCWLSDRMSSFASYLLRVSDWSDDGMEYLKACDFLLLNFTESSFGPFIVLAGCMLVSSVLPSEYAPLPRLLEVGKNEVDCTSDEMSLLVVCFLNSTPNGPLTALPWVSIFISSSWRTDELRDQVIELVLDGFSVCNGRSDFLSVSDAENILLVFDKQVSFWRLSWREGAFFAHLKNSRHIYVHASCERPTRSETNFRQDLFTAYSFFRHSLLCNCDFSSQIDLWFKLWVPPQIFWWIYIRIIKNCGVAKTTEVKWPELRSPVDRVRVRARVRLGLVPNSVSSGYCFYQYSCDMNIGRNMLVSYDTFKSCCAKRQKNCIFRHEFYNNCSKSQFHKNRDENLTLLKFVCHLTTLPLWHVYSFAYDRFNWRDEIRYSFMSFCAKSSSISLVYFSVDIVASKKYFR